jgi:formate-dependent nitrite reductase membrane component NrfD
MILHAASSTAAAASGMSVLMRGVYGTVFWVGVVMMGLLVPLFLEGAELTHAAWASRPHWRRASRLAPVLVLAGGFALRWVIVYAGQAVPGS